jgi:ribonuclease HII
MTLERRGKVSKKGLRISGGPSLFPSLEYEQELHARGIRPVAGVDEAGRGPLAGPVVAAAVILPEGFELEGLDDSKKLNHAKREELFEMITGNPDIRFAIAEASSQEIGHLNILRATHLAMSRALEGLKENGHHPAHALVDGLPAKGLPVEQTALVGGDGLSLSIAAASILAKVTRDRIMEELDREFPQYGFAIHRGYATADHLAMLRIHGPCPHHRLGFAPVDQPTFGF